MGAFGDKLRREREMRGITLSEISESTKISKRWLQALEDEQFDHLPGGVFNRGFVRSYARFLGISDEQAVADYVAASNEQPPPEDKFPLEVHDKKTRPPALNPTRSFIPVLLAIVVLIAGGWTVWVKNRPKSAAAGQSSSERSDQSKHSSGVAPGSNSSSLAGSDADKTASNPTDKSPSEQEHVGQMAVYQKQNGSFSVVIKAKKDSWISIVADGQVLWEGMLNAKKERSIQAGRELILKTGNAAGIEVSYNGKPLGILGKEKEVRTITFNTAGLQQ